MELRRGCRRFRLRRGFRAPAALACAVLISFLAAAAPGAAAGAQWTPISPDLGTATALAFDPRGSGTVYAAAADGQVLRSADRGASWARAGLIAAAGGHIRSLAVSPGDPGLLYAGAPGGLFRSADGGASWSVLAGAGPRVVQVAVAPSDPLTLYVGSDPHPLGRLLRSTDGGATWAPAAPAGWDGVVNALAVDPADPATVYLGGGRFWSSHDGGAHWAKVDENSLLGGVPIGQIVVDPYNSFGPPQPSTGFVAAAGSASWRLFNLDPLHRATLSSSLYLPRTRMAFDAAGGVLYLVPDGTTGSAFRSSDGGATWSPFPLPTVLVPPSFSDLGAVPGRAGSLVGVQLSLIHI